MNLSLSLDISKLSFKSLYISSLPWILSAGAISALLTSESKSLVTNSLIGLGTILSLLFTFYIGKKLEEYKNIPFYYTVLFSGTTILSIILINNLRSIQTAALAEIALNITIWILPGLAITYTFLKKYFRVEILAPIAAHFMDASTTVVSLSRGGVEQQIVARNVIDILGPYGIFMLKTIVIIPAVVMIDRELDYDKKLFYLYLITALGVSIAFRNALLAARGF